MEHPGTHGKPSVLPLLKKIDLEQNNSGKSLNQLLEDGGIDAMITATMPEPFGRNPDIQRMFPNFRQVEADYFKQGSAVRAFDRSPGSSRARRTPRSARRDRAR